MSPSCRRDLGHRGFTLVEVTVAMAVLVIVLVLSGTLLFSMKSFAQKQQSFAEPRQTARRAIDYLAYYIRGASDMNNMNTSAPMPNALVTNYYLNGTQKQATFNNVTDASLADVGTDILTLAKPSPGSIPIQVVGWTGNHGTTTIYGVYTQGCGTSNDDTTNLGDFEQAVGYDATSSASALFQIYDSAGSWGFYQITAAPTSACANAVNSPPSVITMTVTPGGSLNLNPLYATSPSTPVDLNCNNVPCYMTAGLQFLTFRVRTVNGTPRLEQLASPTRLFDQAVDDPGTSFTPLLDNVEDLQVAYIYQDGTIWNSSQQVLPASPYTGNVPTQGSGNPYDAQNVVGLRISVVARSDQPVPTFLGGALAHTPAVAPPEDSTVNYAAGYYHYRLTVTVMIQNRVLGS